MRNGIVRQEDILKAAAGALRVTRSTEKLSVSGDNYGASGATGVNNTWGNTELASPCVIGQAQVLTSSTKRGDDGSKHVGHAFEAAESRLTTLWPCLCVMDFFFFFGRLYGMTPLGIHLSQAWMWMTTPRPPPSVRASPCRDHALRLHFMGEILP